MRSRADHHAFKAIGPDAPGAKAFGPGSRRILSQGLCVRQDSRHEVGTDKGKLHVHRNGILMIACVKHEHSSESGAGTTTDDDPDPTRAGASATSTLAAS